MMDMVNLFLENARGYFSLLRNSQAEYNDTINGLISNYLSSFTDEANIPVDLKDLCGNKDILATTLTTSHDIHLQVSVENFKIVKIIDKYRNNYR